VCTSQPSDHARTWVANPLQRQNFNATLASLSRTLTCHINGKTFQSCRNFLETVILGLLEDEPSDLVNNRGCTRMYRKIVITRFFFRMLCVLLEDIHQYVVPIGVFVQLRKHNISFFMSLHVSPSVLLSVCLSVCLSAGNNSAGTAKDFHEILFSI
jgi:hypothetical protein